MSQNWFKDKGSPGSIFIEPGLFVFWGAGFVAVSDRQVNRVEVIPRAGPFARYAQTS
jgi:hypothetical protein